MNLYNISQSYLAVLDMATDPDNDADIGDTLEAVEGEFEQKAIAVTGYFKSVEADIQAMKDAEESIKARRKTAENAVQRLKDYLQAQMEATGIDKISCPYFVITLAKCPASVEIEDESLIPDEFKEVKITETPNKKAIKEAGGCPGARIVTDKKAIRIR